MRGGPLGPLLAAGLLLAACSQDDKPAPAATPSTTSGDAVKGRQVWLGQCVACHNMDPAKDGPVGPAVKGSSLSLLEAKVLRGEYPPGYKPKRESKVMPPRPDLDASIPDLAAYLH